ncbi:MAG: hypothetical protein Q7J35_13115 [Candidatus Methanoperedens sp.]|nr:hypothetical protein [Candidatus Methanoperedens sp.]
MLDSGLNFWLGNLGLNILALSIYGLENKRINSALHNKMNALMDSQYQKLSFEVNITNKNDNIRIISKKKNPEIPEIFVFESRNGEKEKPLSSENFKNKYNLIYDIPDRPTEKLNQLTEEIKEEQQRYGQRIGNLNITINNIINQISEAGDPNRLSELRKKKDGIQTDKDELIVEKDHTQNVLDILEKYIFLKFFNEYQDKVAYTTYRIEELEKQHNKKSRGKLILVGKYKNKKDEIENIVNEMDNQFRTISSLITSILPKKEENHLKIWNRINLYDSLVDFSFDESLKRESAHFFNVLNKIKTQDEKNETLKDGKVISDLINFLKEYENSGVVLPGVDMKITDFVKALEKQNKKNQKLVDHSKNLDYAINLLNDLDQKRNEVEKELPKLKVLFNKDVDSSDSTEIVDNTSELNELKKRKKEIEDKIKFYYLGCMAKNIDVDSLDENSMNSKIHEMEKNTDLAPYFSYNEKSLTEKISQLENEIKEKNNDLKENDLFLRDYERDIKKLEEKEPHKYQNYSDELNRLYKVYEKLKGKLLNEYNENIKALINIDRPDSKSDLSKLKEVKNQKYFIEVSKYLGRRIDSFRHIDKTYKAARVDLISRKIFTVDDQMIRLDDMGTGQGQSAYLLGLLNTNDNRKIIALFDEVAMMDSLSLEPIYDKFKELYDEDRLLVGIVVQKADEIRITQKMS